ncbi:hypothetical protein Dda_3700 [Drechslerella dactyloides]|uniref:Clr5 domain-containing protein n=1 Tax=Drechslerella dactyloides TaxID=74499 RepID=A0AAD6IYF3_DREDA|nr:hypothetical protein Dda_3700 [Drechslerella dactyloides]
MAKDWAPLQEDIKRLSQVEGRPLKDVMRVIKGIHNFHASERSYRTQLKKWGYMKYNTAGHPVPTNSNQRMKQSARPQSFSLAPAAASASTSIPMALNDNTTVTQTATTPFHLFDINALDSNFSTLGSHSVQSLAPTFRYPDPSPPAIPPAWNPLGLDEQDREGKTLLHRAISGDTLEQVRSLLNAGAAVNIKDHTGNEPLHYAVLQNKSEMVKLLLRFGANVNARGNEGCSPLHLAASETGLLKILLEHGADASSRDAAGDTPLHYALSLLLDPGRIRLLVRNSADINLANNQGVTAFSKLLNRYDILSNTVFDLTILFLESGADVTTAIPNRKLPFQLFLEQCPKDWQKKDRSKSRYWPVSLNKEGLANKAVKLFLEKGADLLTPKVNTGPLLANGNSALHLLSLAKTNPYQSGSFPENWMKTLLDRGANPNLQNKDGQTPLLFVFLGKKTGSQRLKALEVLLAHGANPTLGGFTGQYPLLEASKSLDSEIVTKMIRADRKFRERKAVSSRGDVDAGGCLWLDSWQKAFRAESWAEAKSLIEEISIPVSAEAAEKITTGALAVLAEKHVEMVNLLNNFLLLVFEAVTNRMTA